MTDTQFPTFEVFLMETADDQPRHVGAVHAPDPEMALLNARDVFVRRPRCVGLWVAPADEVRFRTAAQLSAMERASEEPNAPTGQTAYVVFRKKSHKAPLQLSDRFVAATPGQALCFAVALHSDQPAVMWAAVPEASITRTTADQRPDFFEPALAKDYKTHTEYKTEERMREIRRAKGS